jgi:hypothetical protein
MPTGTDLGIRGFLRNASRVGGACLAAVALAATGGAFATSPKPASHYAAGAMTQQAKNYYAMKWGVDELSAKLVESGALVRFNYRVVDAKLAQALQDKAAAPTMIDAKANVSLVIPTLEKVGPLRQAMGVEEGKSYWMAFSNKGSYVKHGHRVSVVIGPVRIDGLIVQ